MPASTPPASSLARAWRSPCSRRTRSAGARPPGTAASSTPATSGAPASSSSATATRPASALYQETLDSYQLVKWLIAEHAIDCDFREVGHLELAYAPSHVPELEHARDSLASVGVDALRSCPASGSARRSAPTPTSGRWPWRAAACSTRAATSPGWPRPPTRAGADLHEGVRATLDPPPGRRPASSSRRRAARSWRGDVFVATNGYTDGVAAVAAPAGHAASARSSSRREPLPEALAHELSPQGPLVLRHEELPVLLARVGRPPDDLRRAGLVPADVDRQDRARSSGKGLLEVHPQLADYRIEYAWGGNVGFTFDRMPHVGRTKDGVTYALGCCGTGVALMTDLGTRVGRVAGRRRGAGPAELSFPLVPAPYEGRPWFLPFAGEWFRLQDRLAARTRTKA